MIIQIIIEVKDKATLRSLEELKTPRSSFNINEMIEDTLAFIVRGDINAINLVDELSALKKIKIIGAFNLDGTKYQFKKLEDSGDVDDEGNPIMVLVNDTRATRKYSRSKYKTQLKNKIVFDDEGNVIEDRPYTSEEASRLQTATIYGWNKKEL